MDHRAKLEWAGEHIEAFQHAIQNFIDDNPCGATTKYNVTTGEWEVRLHVFKRPPADWPLMVGDIVHNLRSALDNLAYELAVARVGRPLSRAEALEVQFPIYDTREGFANKGRKKWLRLMSPDAQAAVEQLQPYHAVDPNRPELLSMLRDVDNVDKHRHLLITTTVGEVTTILVGPYRATPRGTQLINLSRTYEDGAVLGYIKFGGSPPPNVKVKYGILLDVAFGDGWPAYGHSVPLLLQNFYCQLRDVVFPKLEPFL